MGFFFTLILWFASYVLGEMLRPTPQVQNAKAAGLGDFNIPTASEARPVPVIWGTAWVSSPNVLWYGDFSTTPIIKVMKSGKKKVSQTVGYRYYLGMHLGLCMGTVDELIEMRADDYVAWTGSQTVDGVIFVNKPNLFGGDEKGGGLAGNIDLLTGTATHGRNSYLVSKLGADVPAYRNIAQAVLKSFYVGTSTYLKNFFFKVRRCPISLSTTHSNIGGHANPAHIIYELLTDENWGMGSPTSLIDQTAFLAAAQTLYNEGFGMSLVWDGQKSIDDIVLEILRHIDGVLYNNPANGKITISLARADYDPATIPELGESEITRLENFSRTAWDETVNEVWATYFDVGDKVGRSVQAQDLANYHIQGSIVSVTQHYPGAPTAALAGNLAYRDLKETSVPLAKCTIITNRHAYLLKPGSVFALTWPKLGINRLVMRVNRISPGTVINNEIQIDAVQDVYGLGSSIYGVIPPTGWTAPTNTPQDATVVDVLEMPYFANAAYGPENNANEERSVPWVFAAQPDSLSNDYTLQVSTDSGVTYAADQLGNWTKTGVLTGAVAITDSSITVTTNAALRDAVNQDQGDTLFVLGGEICCYAIATDNLNGTWTLSGVWRGLLDTCPQNHLAAARVWFVSDASSFGMTASTYENSDTISLKLLTNTWAGQLGAADAAGHPITFDFRPVRPYPPGHFQVNGLDYPTAIASGPFTWSWAHRDRKQQTAYLVRQSELNIGPETGTTYTLRIYDENSLLIRTVAGLAGTSYTYAEADEMTDSGLTTRLNTSLAVELESVRDGFTSLGLHKWTCNRTDTTPTP